MATIPRPAQIQQLREEALIAFMVEMLVSCPLEEWAPGIARSDWFPRLLKGNSLVERVLMDMTPERMNGADGIVNAFLGEGWEVPMARCRPADRTRDALRADELPLLIIHAPGLDPGPLTHIAERTTSPAWDEGLKKAIRFGKPLETMG